MAITLGLDIGSNSLGWSILDMNNATIIGTGVRVFPEGVDRDTKGTEISKNQTRREARGARRMKFRRSLRKSKLVKLLQDNGLLPKKAEELFELMSVVPYDLRSKGLDEELSLYEFGRCLFHINQRRGFKSNRKTGKSNEDGVVAKSAGELQMKVNSINCRTLGEYFAKIDPEQERIRGQYTFRSMFEHEFDLLWEKQSEYHPDILTEEFKPKIKEETIFFQRPLKPSDDLIGDCSLEEDEKRCPRGDWYARRFRILQDLNNLIIRNPDGSEAILDNDQRRQVLGELLLKKEVRFDRLRKLLGLLETQIFNLEDDGQETKLKGDEFAAQLRSKKILGAKGWKALDIKEQIEINEVIIDDDVTDEQLIEMLVEQHNFSKKQAEETLSLTLPQRYMRFSRIAIQKLLPFMEKGFKTHEAVKEVYGDQVFKQQKVGLDKLDMPEDLRNPIVQKALYEVRKVVNAIIREYGKPDSITVEMARDVCGSKDQRRKVAFKNKENEKLNDMARKELIENIGIINPSRNDIIKYKLWNECGYECPYTGRSISQNSLFGNNPEFQVEHIIPYSRCLDDSYMNKTLCYVRENIDKGNQTPYEFYCGNTEQYEGIKQRIACLPYPKKQRFLEKDVELDGFVQRQLNDTRYISKEVVSYLKRLGVAVRGTKGQSTAALRHSWGLNNILSYTAPGIKNRDDHRHHAIDAAVVALTTSKHLKELARCKYSVEGRKFTEPWEGFRDELEHKVNEIIVSHRVTRKLSGQLHDETAYGPTGLKDKKGQFIFVYRKKLEDLTLPMVNKIVDPVIKKIVIGRLKEYGIDPVKKQKIDKEVWSEPLYMITKTNKRGPQIKKVRIRDVFNNMINIKDRDGKPYRSVAPGSNHHIEIVEYKDKNGKIKKEGHVVTMFEAVKRSQNKRPVIKTNHGPDKKFFCSLAKNEMFMLEVADGTHVPHRIQKIVQDGRISLRQHTFAGKISESDLPPLIQRRTPNTLRGYKISVDPLGRIYSAND